MFKIAFADFLLSSSYDHPDASLFSFQEAQPGENILPNLGHFSDDSGLHDFENLFASSGLPQDEPLFPIEDDFAPSGLSDTREWNEGESLFAIGDDLANLNLPDNNNNEWNDGWLSSCPDDTNWQPSKLRARNAVCPTPADPRARSSRSPRSPK